MFGSMMARSYLATNITKMLFETGAYSIMLRQMKAVSKPCSIHRLILITPTHIQSLKKEYQTLELEKK